MRQEMQETLHETADAGDTLWYSRCRRHSVRQEMKETLRVDLTCLCPFKAFFNF